MAFLHPDWHANHHLALSQVLSLQHSGSKDSSQSQFAFYWKPILSMDANVWQRWLHMHRIAMILEHDMWVRPTGSHFSVLTAESIQRVLCATAICFINLQNGHIQFLWDLWLCVCSAPSQSMCTMPAVTVDLVPSSAGSHIRHSPRCWEIGAVLSWWRATRMSNSYTGTPHLQTGVSDNMIFSCIV